MPFDFLEQHGLLPGTSFTEQGKTVSLERRDNETARFFRIDTRPFREHFQVASVCDLMVEYRERAFSLLLFVELKGTKLADAERQIVGAINAVRSCLEGQCTLRALVVASGVAPKIAASMQRRVKQQTTAALFFKSMKRGTLSLRPYVTAKETEA